MSPVGKILVCTFAVIALLGGALALECYSCDSQVDSNCNDAGYSGNTITEVAGAECKYCFKATGKVAGKDNTARGCFPDAGLPPGVKINGCQSIDVPQQGSIEYCICDDMDKCNGVGRLSGSILAVLAVALLKFLW